MTSRADGQPYASAFGAMRPSRAGCNRTSETSRANESANETPRDGGDEPGTSETEATGRAWSARRTCTPETPETGVVVLITQRSQVQILPPLPNVQVRGLFRFREGPSYRGVLTSLLTALRPSDFPALLAVPSGSLANGGRVADCVGIEAGSSGSLLHSAPVGAADSGAVSSSASSRACWSPGARAPQPRDECWCPERTNSRYSEAAMGAAFDLLELCR